MLVVLTGAVVAVTAYNTARDLLKGEIGVDIIALLAMIGALVLGQYLAGAIIAVMLASGMALERYAIARARRELSTLISRAPRIAHRGSADHYADVAVQDVRIGDVLMVKPGEVVPVDGIVGAQGAVVDESSLTGESRPVKLEAGAPLRSGGANAGGPFEARVTATAADSTYAGSIRLVQAAADELRVPLPFAAVIRDRLLALLAQGAKGDTLPKEVWNGARPEKWRRLHPDRPAYTILAQMHRDLSEWVHPDHERWITVREAARLQSFHDGFIFKTSEWQMLKQVGNAVPPLLARAIASAAEAALERLDHKQSSLQFPLYAQPALELDLEEPAPDARPAAARGTNGQAKHAQGKAAVIQLDEIEPIPAAARKAMTH